MQGGLGSDVLTVGGLRRGACVNAVGGGGADELLPSVATDAREERVDIDLKRGEFGVRVGQAVCGFVASVEDLTMVNPFTGPDGPRWHVRGTTADETVVLRKGASIWASMAGGDDRVPASAGDDNLKGGPGDDRLYGGGGHNIANGGDGTDTCRKVAFKRQCELPGWVSPARALEQNQRAGYSQPFAHPTPTLGEPTCIPAPPPCSPLPPA